jgi:hypothetical protein
LKEDSLLLHLHNHGTRCPRTQSSLLLEVKHIFVELSSLNDDSHELTHYFSQYRRENELCVSEV